MYYEIIFRDISRIPGRACGRALEYIYRRGQGWTSGRNFERTQETDKGKTPKKRPKAFLGLRESHRKFPDQF